MSIASLNKPISASVKIFLYVLCLLALMEGCLRFQQKIGPITDLEFEGYGYEGLSDTFNHVNVPGRLVTHPELPDLVGTVLVRHYDELGMRVNPNRPIYPADVETFKVLFLGDSFMYGFGDEDTIPQHIWEYFQSTEYADRPVTFHNAAVCSYSPAVFVPQVKKLIPILKPDYVVIDIDETDLGQDFIWYENLLTRNERGSIERVSATPRYARFVKRIQEIKANPFYIYRLFGKWYSRYVFLPRLMEEHKRDYGRDPLDISRDQSDNSRQKHDKEIKVFQRNLRDLSITLNELIGVNRVAYLYHPHLNHIQKDADGNYWNTFVSDSIGEVAREFDILFYDATRDISKEFGDTPESFYLKEDMHFNYEGLKVYSELIARRLFPVWEPRLKEMNSYSGPVSYPDLNIKGE